MENLLDMIFEEMYNDDVDPIKESNKLIIYYSNLDEDKKQIADNILTYICGLSLRSLIERFRHQEQEA